MKKLMFMATMFAVMVCSSAFTSCSSDDDEVSGLPGTGGSDEGSGGKVLLDVAKEIYAVDKNGNLTKLADKSCIGVAVKLGDDHSFMIEKKETECETYKNIASVESYMKDNKVFFYCATEKYDTLYDGNYSLGKIGSGAFADRNGVVWPGFDELPSDYRLWTNGVLSHWNGKELTEMLMSKWDGETIDRDNMYSVEKLYTEFLKNSRDNMGYDDWYIPTLAHLSQIMIHVEDINKALNAIGGTPFNYYLSGNYNPNDVRLDNVYMAVNETPYLFGSTLSWCVVIDGKSVGVMPKIEPLRVRFVRDIK